jgi:hypothetical protein
MDCLYAMDNFQRIEDMIDALPPGHELLAKVEHSSPLPGPSSYYIPTTLHLSLPSTLHHIVIYSSSLDGQIYCWVVKHEF